MQRVSLSEQEQKFVNRWRLLVVAAYSTAALMVVLIAAFSSAPRDATLAARMEPTGFARPLSAGP